MKISKILLPSALLIAVAHQAAAEGATKQEGPIMGQTSMDCGSPLPGGGPRPVIDGASATLLRGPNGITASVSMPTPVSGSYCYPPATLLFDPAAGPAVAGHPEAFSLWGIYFNAPAQCLGGECSVADVLGPNCANAQAGAVQLSGHIVGGRLLHMTGHLSVGEGPLAGPGLTLGCAPLLDADGAEVHLAVAPHGLLMPHLMPEMIETPPGGGPGYWFPSVFEGVD